MRVVVASGAVALWASVASAAEGGVECSLLVALKSSAVSVGSLQFRLGYGSTSGWVAGHGNNPDCTALLGDVISAFSDDEKNKALRGGFAGVEGVAAPFDVASCVFRGDSIPEPGDFELVVEDAADADTLPIDPTPVLEVSVLDCEPIDSLTTSTTTTTTTSTTLPQCGNWQVVLGIDSASKPVGRLRVNLDHVAADGEFVRNVGVASCNSLVEGATVTGYQFYDGTPLAVTMTSVPGVASGLDFASCLFSGTWADAPVAADFVATVHQSADTDSMYLPVTLTVSVSALTAPDACEGTCGDGVAQVPDEECDDANGSDTDTCPHTCKAAECGDGFVEAGVEPCDDGNPLNSDGCVLGCKVARCGDHYVHNGVEECDDGNSIETDVCRNGCIYAQCGDGVVHDGAEECDDGGTTGGDGCSADCAIEHNCGDPVIGGGITVSDALRILQSAVGLIVDCPMSVCDVNGNESVTTIDALIVLRVSVGIEMELNCRGLLN